MNHQIVRRGAGSLLAAAFATVVVVGGAVAQDACEPFSLIGTQKAVSLLDRGPPGDSPGDRRIVMTALTDEAGEQFAVNYVVATLVGPGEDGDTRFSARIDITFENGELFGASVYERPNDDMPNPKPITIVIQDGTGIFEGAQGWIDVGTQQNPSYAFNIFCD